MKGIYNKKAAPAATAAPKTPALTANEAAAPVETEVSLDEFDEFDELAAWTATTETKAATTVLNCISNKFIYVEKKRKINRKVINLSFYTFF